MFSELPADIQQSISAFVANGSYPNEAEVLRDAMRLLNQRQEDIQSIQRGLDDIANGNVRPANASNEAFRSQNNLPQAQ